MQNTYSKILLIFLLYISATITACCKLGAFGFLITIIILAIVMYILSPYLKKIANKVSLFSSSGDKSDDKTSAKGSKASTLKISVSSYGPAKIELRLGKNLTSYAEGYYDGSLPVLTAKLRNKLQSSYNFVLPPISIVNDNIINENEFKIRIYGREIFYGSTNSNHPTEEIAKQLEQCVMNNLDELTIR